MQPFEATGPERMGVEAEAFVEQRRPLQASTSTEPPSLDEQVAVAASLRRAPRKRDPPPGDHGDAHSQARAPGDREARRPTTSAGS
jgi:hypothetical protein